MKKYVIFCLVCLLALPALSQARKKYRSDNDERHHYSYHNDRHRNSCYSIDDSYMSFEDGTLYIFSDYFDEEIEITEKAELIIDGNRIDLTEKQKQLVAAFYSESLDVQRLGKKMGELGGKMGAIGGQMGTIGALIGQRAARQAYTSLAVSLSDSYSDFDDDDFDDDVEEYLDKLEDKMDELEDKMENSEDEMDVLSERMEVLGEKMEVLGDEMEDEADEMEDAFDEMRDAIPALEKLDW